MFFWWTYYINLTNEVYFPGYQRLIYLLLLLSIPIVLYFLFKVIVSNLRSIVLIYCILIVLTTTIKVLSLLYYKEEFDYILMDIIYLGLTLIWAMHLFKNRYIASMSDTTIYYRNLLGQNGEIALKSITMLEQKKNLLTFIGELRFLSFFKRTAISFKIDGDEYVIYIFPKTNQGKNYTFNLIVEKARLCGNDKIRQYVI
jgi:hypothetical protein